MFSRFDTVRQCDERTDRRTGGVAENGACLVKGTLTYTNSVTAYYLLYVLREIATWRLIVVLRVALSTLTRSEKTPVSY